SDSGPGRAMNSPDQTAGTRPRRADLASLDSVMERADLVNDARPTTTERIRQVLNWLLGWPLSLLLALWCLGAFVSWVPVYMTFPWYTDHDHFAVIARAWDHGELPYARHHSNQFPGEIYLFWLHGKLSGWGRSDTFYALDAALVGNFGGLLVWWSRREFGRV